MFRKNPQFRESLNHFINIRSKTVPVGWFVEVKLNLCVMHRAKLISSYFVLSFCACFANSPKFMNF